MVVYIAYKMENMTNILKILIFCNLFKDNLGALQK